MLLKKLLSKSINDSSPFLRCNSFYQLNKYKFSTSNFVLHRSPIPNVNPPEKKDIKGIKHIVAVSSGKGGVGKSTVSVNLSIALSTLGLRVGILDADIYGPSIPLLLNLKNYVNEEGKSKLSIDPSNNNMIPLQNYGLKAIMSIGFLIPPESPIVWRGPRVMGAVSQLLHQVEWGDLDVLLIDMPPGTGDVALSISQQLSLSGSVVVSTPQDLAFIDAIKGINMFRQVNVPILGIVENMSHYVCSNCKEKQYIFGKKDYIKDKCKEENVTLLGEIPLNPIIGEKNNEGTPITISDPQSDESLIFTEMANKIYSSLSEQPDRNSSDDIEFVID
eukprot:TRINITY_DN11644_c0_g1_i1.p1 TRINITY_DN11644_c0_g1~~TRINITY_DN11644_c0_g1_i1.p1  ORF type:complete len:332 (+),score=81.59 TRINITY_DN11644_c0_g1_i1:29-1024(+)